MNVVRTIVFATKSLFARGLTLAAFSCLLLAHGCSGGESGSTETSTREKDKSGAPAFDVRGGISDSDVLLGSRTVGEGLGGAGGSFRVTTSGGNITMSNGALVSAAQATIIAGSGFDVASGQTRTVAGAFTVSWLRVQAGGTLVLDDDTLFVVTGDVEISGRINGRGDEHLIDGRDLTIDADGIVNITGTIDCSGLTVQPDDKGVLERNDFAGGRGGQIYISSLETTLVSPGPHVFITGKIFAEGGDTFSKSSATSIPGRGGQILIGSFGTVATSGRISAHGGKCYFSPDGSEGDGGSIELVALGNFEIARVRQISATGGDSSGPAAGNGGTILLEAPVGTLDFDNFDIFSRGGNTTFSEAGIAGDGGTITLTAGTVSLTNVNLDVRGGNATVANSGQGGDGGAAQIAGATAITVAPDVFINAEGGQTNLAATAGGAGGNVRVINLDESNATALDFQGAATVEGGKNAIRSTGTDGEICAAGSNAASDVKLIGTNNFPIAGCSGSDIDTLVVHDLDCDDATITPDQVDATLPAVIGVDFFRVVKTAGMVTAGVTTVTVTITGSSGGNIDLYTGPASALGSTNTGSYTQSSTAADSDETLDVDITGIAAGSFFSVLLAEQSTFVEDYTIALTCQ